MKSFLMFCSVIMMVGCIEDEPTINETLPKRYANVPVAEDIGLVEKVVDITEQIKGFNRPYNPSIVELANNRYLLSFRYNVGTGGLTRTWFMGSVELDSSLNVDGIARTINTGTSYSEDARLFTFDKRVFLTYNDSVPPVQGNALVPQVSVLIGELSQKNGKWDILKQETFAPNSPLIGPVEKNWVPFFSADVQNPWEIKLAYSLAPHRIGEMENIEANMKFRDDMCSRKLPGDFGKPRGGTPAKLINGEYLAFYHSSFDDPSTKMRWYTFGAYTFEKDAPYCITRISKHPIKYRGIFGTKLAPQQVQHWRVVFPMGFVEYKKGDKEYFVVALGENDAASKLVYVNRKALYESLVPVGDK